MSLCFVFTAPSLGMYAGEIMELSPLLPEGRFNAHYNWKMQNLEGESEYFMHLSIHQAQLYINQGCVVMRIVRQGEEMREVPFVGTPPSRCAKFFKWLCCK